MRRYRFTKMLCQIVPFADDLCIQAGAQAILVLLRYKRLCHRGLWRCRPPADVAHPRPVESPDTANQPNGLFRALYKGSVMMAEVDSRKQQDELLANATRSKAFRVGASNAYFRSLGLPSLLGND